MTHPVQPLLHSETLVLRAPAQAWSGADGSMGSAPIHGFYLSDVRILSGLSVLIGGSSGETIATIPDGADAVAFIALLRDLDDRAPDPRVRSIHRRRVTIDGVSETIRLQSTLSEPVETAIIVRLAADLASIDEVKAGLDLPLVPITIDGVAAVWGNGASSASLAAPGATLRVDDVGLELSWPVTIPAKGSVTVGWSIVAIDESAVVVGKTTPLRWSVPTVTAGDDRIIRWLDTALADLDALRLSTVADPASEFLAAGAPWFFTLFGRDSIWAARFMLPLGTTLAGDTLRVLAGLQGTRSVPDTAEQPGKIMHELRRGVLKIPSAGISLPPLYFGTVDATALWACLLHDAWRWGLPETEVVVLLPHLVATLEWMRDYGDADGDGLLEYVDATGRGLANQGWKDSGDSVQWRDGTLADGPIALCEVQAYAYQAAIGGAELLDHFGLDGASEWRAWAARLRTRFNESFWIDDPAGAYPAIALDSTKRRVDTVTSNIGHLLGTGLLDARQAALVARRLVSPQLNSGFGLRTMSTDSEGYWPLSYHGGSVWTHDTAIAIAGLARDGFGVEAASLVSGLLAAASGFDYRMPELHSGDASGEFSAPVPYPAACRPQAWSAAASVSVLASTLGLRPDAASATLGVSPIIAVGALAVRGLRFGGADVSITVNAEGEVTASSGAAVQVE
ncbi:MAG: glycogen debranching N-terminal domain-containing protein [Actinomycetota bacterium]